MRIGLIVEGDTEKAFLPHLRRYLETRLSGNMPKIVLHKYDGHIPKEGKLQRVVQRLLSEKPLPAHHVIALTDVYTGIHPPKFRDAEDAKGKMRGWVGNESRFHPHVAQFDFEAWLLPYWPAIQKLARHNQSAPGPNPEQVNHQNPPARRIARLFEIGACRDSYVKPRDAGRILRDADLSIAIDQCPELKSLINTILTICDSKTID